MIERLSPEMIRQVAFMLHDVTDWSRHPCTKGRGKCCVVDVPVTLHDQGVIKDGVRKGEISQDVVEQAKIRAETDNTRCPFLNESRSCSIYSHRPAICAATGTAGEPTTHFPETVKDVARGAVGEKTYIPVFKTASSMCSECHNVLVSQRACFSGSMMYAFQQVMMYYRMNPKKPMIEFVKEL